MKAALDVSYQADRAIAACVIFQFWEDIKPRQLLRTMVPAPARYQPGRFYERELPCLLAVLQEANRTFETIVIDGFVHLQPEVGKGLGTHLAEALPYQAAVIGVAKKPLQAAIGFVPVLRGQSRKPVYVSAIGCSLDQAALAIASMPGQHRIPTMLRIADEHSRHT